MPASAPTEESASERWCHASAMNALELMARAQWRVYQNIPSFATIDTIAAMRAMRLGVAVSRYDPVARLSAGIRLPAAEQKNQTQGKGCNAFEPFVSIRVVAVGVALSKPHTYKCDSGREHVRKRVNGI